MKARYFLPLLLLSFILVGCATSKVKSTADGSSVENAIPVKSIDEEYKIVRERCPGCKFAGQRLISKNGKHYDVLDFVNGDGKKVSYYFDINSFFGKW